jgi:membrane protein
MSGQIARTLRQLMRPAGAKPAGIERDAAAPVRRGRHALMPSTEDESSEAIGLRAAWPSEIPPRGWWQVLGRVWQQNNEDDLGNIAASCAFYTLLAMFPAMSAFVALYGLAFNPADVERQLADVAPLLPSAVFTLLAERLKALVSTGNTSLGWGAALGLLVALYSAMAGTKALFSALNIVYEEREKRSFLAFNLQALVFTLGTILGLITALSLIVVLPAVLAFVGLSALTDLVLRSLRWPLLGVLLLLGISMLYRFGPSRRAAKWRWISPGALLATLLFLVASIGFSFYVANFASYDKTYGSLGAVVILLLWLWVSAYAVLLGGELNAELELQTLRDSTVGPDRRIGRRGAFVADTIAAKRR